MSKEQSNSAVDCNSDNFVRLLCRMESDPNTYAEFAKQFGARAEALRAEGNSDPESVINTLMNEMYAQHASRSSTER